MTLPHRALGDTGFDVSEVGLGCWQIGADWGTTSDATARAILEEAYSAGVTFFDTADVYGMGRSETFLGEFLRTLDGPRPHIATKFGRAPGVYPNTYSRETLRAGVQGSLERLGLDQLDLVQLHCIPPSVLEAGNIFDWLRELKDEGLIAHFGASVESMAEARVAMAQEGLLSLQVIFNLFRQRLITDLIPEAADKGIGLIVRLPLASGILAGKMSRDTVFEETDHRNFNRNGAAFNVGETFAGVPFETGLDLVERLRALVPEGMTMADMANRWILDHPAVSTIIPGASQPEQIARNAKAANLPPLSTELHATLSAFYKEHVDTTVRGPY